jgi:apolipoprotein N-acyltransferase
MIDPLGRVSTSLALDKMGAIDARLPAALGETLYARFGDLLFLLLWIGAALAAFMMARTRRPAGHA